MIPWLVTLLIACIPYASAQIGVLDCPPPWEAYSDKCYKFELYPANFQEATQQCGKDSASVVSINSRTEHQFITSKLQAYEKQHRGWYTSGRRNSTNPPTFSWEGDGTNVEGFQFWLSDDDRKNPDVTKTKIVYKSILADEWWWVLENDTAKRPFICEINKADTYRIVQEERGFGYGLPVTDPLKFTRGPKFLEQPEDIIFDEPDESSNDRRTKVIVMECRADASPRAQYDWFLERGQEKVLLDPLKDRRYTMSNGRLTINQPNNKEDNGQYQCLAKNQYGSILSNVIQVSFGYLRDFPKSKRDTMEVEQYAGLGIECNPPKHGYPSLLYSWYKDSIQNFVRPELKTYTFISHNGKLYFSSVTKDDQGDYFCVVSSPFSHQSAGKGGKVSMPNPVKVREAIAQEREPQIVPGFPTVFPSSPKRGDNIRMECMAWGTQQLDYTWDKVGGQIVGDYEFLDNNRVLNIHNVQLVHSGTYSCRVQRRNGQSSTARVQLSVEASPFFTIPMRDQHIGIKEDLTWRCNGDGLPAVTTKWYRNGTELKKENMLQDEIERFKIQNNILQISSLKASDAAMYQCEASNAHGSTFSSAQLRVLSIPPTFLKYPLQPNMYATKGGSIIIRCNPEAAPRVDITWLKDKRPYNGNPPRTIILPNGNLQITQVRDSDAGNYTCVAVNVLGEARSTGSMSVVGKSVISTPPRDTVVQVNRTVFLHCEASYDPVLDLTYEWYHNNFKIEFIRVKTDGSSKVWIEKDRYYQQGTGIYRGGLYIKSTQFFHAGEYECRARTSSDTIKTTASLQVIGPPSPPSGAVGLVPTSDSIPLRWSDGFNNGRPVTGYKAEKCAIPHKDFLVVHCVWMNAKLEKVTTLTQSGVEMKQGIVTGLSPYSSYRFRVTAENVLGEGEPSEPTTIFTMLAEKPTKYPNNLRGGGGKVGVLTIEWDEMPLEDLHGLGVGYNVSYRKARMQDEKWEFKVLKGRENSRHVALVGSKNFYTEYNVRIQVFNKMGMGPPSPGDLIIRSSEGLPVVTPLEIRGAQHNCTALWVEWNPVEDTIQNMKGLLKGYRINYWRRDEEDYLQGQFREIQGQTDHGMIIGLHQDTYYMVNVQVFNTAGLGQKSEDFPIKTLRTSPKEAPQEVRVSVVDADRIRVDWRGVTTDIEEEPLEGYIVRYWRQGENIYVAKDIDNFKKTWTYIDGLEKAVIYNIRVLGYSRGGDGLQSSPAVQVVLGPGCQIAQEIPDSEYVYGCRGGCSILKPHLFIYLLSFLYLLKHFGLF